jgi:tRNA threonylcarbamoyladenosine biosynthesis protein TsaB
MLFAIDTSTRTVGLALYDGIQVIGETIWTSHDYHTVELAPAVAETLDRCGVDLPGLKVIAVAIGPGSFTGLRIGMALAKGMCLARHLPLIGIPTMDILAAAQPVLPMPLAIVLKAGRGRLAVGWYHAQNGSWTISEKGIEVLDIHRLAQRIQQPTMIAGELNEEERRALARKYKNVNLASPAQAIRRPAFLAELAWKRWLSGQLDDPATLAPVYLHHGEPIPG